MNTVVSANPRTYQPNAKYVLLLGLMFALPAVTSDIYLPSLPDVARDLHTTTTAVQLTMTGSWWAALSASWSWVRSRTASDGGDPC